MVEGENHWERERARADESCCAGAGLVELQAHVVPPSLPHTTVVLSVKTVDAHVASIFRALDLDATTSDNRRVKAALTFLAAQSGQGRPG